MPAISGQRGKKRKAPEDDGRTGPPYQITCPALPQDGRRKKGDFFYDSDYPGDKTLETHKDLEVTYSIEPGTEWRNALRGYSRMRYQDEEIKVGDFVFVNKDTGLSAVPSDLNNDELVKWHLNHSYVGRIQQIRAVQAAKTDKVYLMIFYLYWPEELPGGRASYHGKREVVLSNHAELIEAQTVSDFADIQFWDEGDESVIPPRELYYRQTYNVAKAADGRLSQLRKHCVCRKEHNPDKIMYHCSHKECVAWNHEECLEDALLKTLKTHRQKGTLTSYLDERAAAWLSKKESQSKPLADRITAGAESFVHRVRDSVMHHIEGEKSTPVPEDLFDAVEALTPGSRQKKAEADAAAAAAATATQKKNKAASNKGELDVTIKQAGAFDSVVAEVTLLPGKDPSATSPRSWEIQLDCLVCKQPLD